MNAKVMFKSQLCELKGNLSHNFASIITQLMHYFKIYTGNHVLSKQYGKHKTCKEVKV